ncbi:hypothetical protein C7999DRAFT_37980 [Corynascus novoguineensis]|uniref:Uncharacterized protein n=1 Tax=Corynascus novoguineensis TaxID=1126955 RepID=A0AAN7CZ83_9PEZI|nr:hypothetical protein C7999DRAFT_37980 [Corynascus novoguineensis]
MTNQGDPSGPSLVQARSTRHGHDHAHNHNHNHQSSHQHLHFHQHRRLQPVEVDSASPHIRSPPSDKLHGRHVVIVQTVSVVQYIDATGAVTGVETLTPDYVEPTEPALPAAVTSILSAIGDVLPSVSLSGLIPDLTDGAPSETSPSFPASSETLTSAPLTASVFPTLSRVFNTSSTYTSSLFGNHTRSLYSNSTRTSTALRSAFASKSSSSLWTTTTDGVVATFGAGDGSVGNGASPDPTEPTSEAPSGLTPETRNAVVGGVVGSVAGIALIAFALMFLLKWRRQRGQGIMLLGDGDSTHRGNGFSSPEPVSPSSGRAMAERGGAFVIPSALARMSGKRALEAPPADPAPQEKGFYRVSGRKLISVLESGGDGYSDPHDSVGSGSSHYRDSQGFLDSSNPFQLGSPMRPVSGVPIFRDGAQRTPIHEQGPLPPGHRPSVFPTTSPISDSVSRPFAFRDGPRGSGSRFTEDA